MCTAVAFLWNLAVRGRKEGGVPLAWEGWPAPRDLIPFADVACKLFTRTLFKMAAFASISTVAMRLKFPAPAIHQVCVSFLQCLQLLPMEEEMNLQRKCMPVYALPVSVRVFDIFSP
jgi:hypothetical protein